MAPDSSPDDEAAAFAASALRAAASNPWILGVSGCALPNTRFHTAATDSRISTASRRSYYAMSLKDLSRFDEARALLRKVMPVARRVLGESYQRTLEMRWLYAMTLYQDDAATLDDLREAVETLESVAPLWKRVFGPAHPETPKLQLALKNARKALAARSAASSSGAA